VEKTGAEARARVVAAVEEEEAEKGAEKEEEEAERGAGSGEVLRRNSRSSYSRPDPAAVRS